MNLADYLSELLGVQDEVHLPGLGYFVRTRVNAYYNDREGRFYPPYHQVAFIEKTVDDDSFAQYVADKKNISLASSKYFVEKFITKLKEDSSRGKFLFADLGSFQMDVDRLTFKPNERIPADPAFYGYPPVDIFRDAQPAAPAYTSAPATAPAPSPVAATTPPPPRAFTAPDYYEEDVEEKRRSSIWLIVIIILAVLGLGAFAVYKFYPSAFDKVKNMVNGKKPDTTAVIRHQVAPVNKDTAQKVTPPVDTAAKPAAVTAKADSLPTWEAIVGQMRDTSKANAEVSRLQARGYKAYIVPNTIGVLKKVSVGDYPSYLMADSVSKQLKKLGIIMRSYPPLEIRPNK